MKSNYEENLEIKQQALQNQILELRQELFVKDLLLTNLEEELEYVNRQIDWEDW